MSQFELTASQCDCGLVDFYKNVCIAAGQDPCNIDLRFDCRNIHVTASVQERIFMAMTCNVHRRCVNDARFLLFVEQSVKRYINTDWRQVHFSVGEYINGTH